MAITGTCHVESVAGSGVASVVTTCQRVEEPRGIRRRKWSGVVAIIVVCQGVMEPYEICCRRCSRVVAVAGLPGGLGLSAGVRLGCMAERGGKPPV